MDDRAVSVNIYVYELTQVIWGLEQNHVLNLYFKLYDSAKKSLVSNNKYLLNIENTFIIQFLV